MGQLHTKYLTMDITDKDSIQDAKADLAVSCQRGTKYTAVQITLINVPINDVDSVRHLFGDTFPGATETIDKRGFFDKKGTVRIILNFGPIKRLS
jgi:hypothetical protein